jgi:hypothetical protein
MKFNAYEPPPIPAEVLKTLMAITKKYGKCRCRVSEEKILFLLKKFHGIDICRATLCHWLAFLSENRFIAKAQYMYENGQGVKLFGANTYWLLPRAIKYLRSLVGWAKKAFWLYRVYYTQHHERPTDLNKYVVGSLSRCFRSLEDDRGVPLPMS